MKAKAGRDADASFPPRVSHDNALSRFAVPRVRDLPASSTLAVAKEAESLRHQGIDVVDFGPGEPDFDTPWNVRQAAIGALKDGLTHYAPSRGVAALREAIAEQLQRKIQLWYDPSTEILVTPGAKQAVLEAVMTGAAAGDEVIIFDPAWGSYSAIVQLAGATPVHVTLRQDFTIDPERFHAALSSRSKVVLVGSPANPTGHILDDREWSLVADACREHDLLLISDEIYDRITYGTRCTSPAILPEMWGRTVTINGFSKAYAMTGWRLGYAAAPADFIGQMLKVHEHSVTTAATFVQVGGVEAIRGDQKPVQQMVAEFDRRRNIIVTGLNDLPGIRCLAPEGAFYVFPDISGTGLTGTELASLLLRHAVAVTPGIGFGDGWDTHVRLSFAVSEERIRTGLARMAKALSST